MDANAYLASFSPEEQQRIRASWAGNQNGLQDWFGAASKAGAVPGTRPPGTIAGMQEGGWEAPGEGKYTTVDFTGVATPDQWMGKRMPTAAEARLWAQQQHAAYTGGNRQAQDEDWARYSDQQVQAWLNEGWDPATGGWKQGYDAHGQIMPWAQPGTKGTSAPLQAAGMPAQSPAPQTPQSQTLTNIMAAYQGQQAPQTSRAWSTGGYGGANLQNMQSSLQGLMTGANKAAGQPAPQAGQWGGGAGWNSTQGGLKDMLTPLQQPKRKQNPNSWF